MSDETVNKIVRAARKLIRSEHIKKINFDRIAEEAGFTRGALYYNFKSKHDLFLCVLEHMMERRMANLGEALADTPDELRVATIADAFAQDVADWRFWTPLLMEIWLEAIASPPLMQRLAAVREHAYVQVTDVLRQAFPKAPIERVKEFSVIWIGFYPGIAVELSISGRSLGLEQLRDFLIGGLEAHFRAAPSTRKRQMSRPLKQESWL